MSLLITHGLGPTTGPSASLQINSLSVGAGYVSVEFTATLNPMVVQLETSLFSITSNSGAQVSTKSLEIASPFVLKINTTEQTTGVTYTLALPRVGIVSSDGMPLTTPYSANFTGIGIAPVTVLARSIDAKTIHVIFSEGVRSEEATVPSNYSFVPSLSVISVTKINDSQYELTTSKQSDLTLYTVTVSNIRD
ncbi:hypothetical protein EB118_23540, partial [bacterium]|nr:hypothetical protein [bacterium]